MVSLKSSCRCELLLFSPIIPFNFQWFLSFHVLKATPFLQVPFLKSVLMITAVVCSVVVVVNLMPSFSYFTNKDPIFITELAQLLNKALISALDREYWYPIIWTSAILLPDWDMTHLLNWFCHSWIGRRWLFGRANVSCLLYSSCWMCILLRLYTLGVEEVPLYCWPWKWELGTCNCQWVWACAKVLSIYYGSIWGWY